MKRVAALAGLAAWLFTSQAIASQYYCAYQVPTPPYPCGLWAPGTIPGSSPCGTNPGSGEVYVFTGKNYTGWCQSLPTGTWVPDASAVGWNNTTPAYSTTLHVNSVKVGIGRQFNSYIFTNGGCYPAPFSFCYAAVHDSADTSGWPSGSFYVQ